MPYNYQTGSNYAAGDYYRGDIFGLLGKAVKVGVGAIKGGAKALGIGGRPPSTALTGPSIPQVPAPGLVAGIQRFVPGGATGMMPVSCGTNYGYHANKALTRYARALERGGNVQDPRSRPRVVNECVRNRSMNPANPKALRRAIRREAAFVALAKRTLKGSGYTFKRTGVAKASKRRKK